MLSERSALENEIGGEIAERGENEGPFEHEGMGEGQAFVAQCEIAVEQHIQVESARSPALAADPAARLFDGEAGVEQSMWRESGRKRDGGVEVILLAGGTHGGGFITGGTSGYSRVGQGIEGGAGRIEMGMAVAEIGAERDVGGGGMDGHAKKNGRRSGATQSGGEGDAFVGAGDGDVRFVDGDGRRAHLGMGGENGGEDAVGERLDEGDAFAGDDVAHEFVNLRVVDGVGEIVGRRRVGDVHHQIEIDDPGLPEHGFFGQNAVVAVKPELFEVDGGEHEDGRLNEYHSGSRARLRWNRTGGRNFPAIKTLLAEQVLIGVRSRMRWRWIFLLVMAVQGTVEGMANTMVNLSREDVLKWLHEFEVDHQQRGTPALLERIDEQALSDRALAASGLVGEEPRHLALTRQSIGELRVASETLTHLRFGRRMDEGSHWTVMTYFWDPAGMFIFRRFRIEKLKDGGVRITDWADMPCDVAQSEVVARMVFVQTLAVPDKAPERMRAELTFFHKHPMRYVKAVMAVNRQDMSALLREVVTMPPEARFGVLARHWRTTLLAGSSSSGFLENRHMLVGSRENDPLRGLLLFRAGTSGNRPEIALEGLSQLSAQLDHDVDIRTQTIAMLILADRVDEAVDLATETAELYPANYSGHIQRLAALWFTGHANTREGERARLAAMLGKEAADTIDHHTEVYITELEQKRREIVSSNMTREKRERRMKRTSQFESAPIRLDYNFNPIDGETL